MKNYSVDSYGDDRKYSKKYMDMSDEDLVILSKEGDSEASELLLIRYKNAVRARARSFFLSGGEKEDLIQEGMFGLYKAMRDFTPNKSSFKNFAFLCINRQIISAIKNANRSKHIPLNNYISLNHPRDEDGNSDYMEFLEGAVNINPEDVIIEKEEKTLINNEIKGCMSKLEQEILRYYLEGLSYCEISEKTGRDLKAIDNALQRVRKKLEAFLLKPMFKEF